MAKKIKTLVYRPIKEDSARVSALFEAELSECSMGGNLCGVSTGDVTEDVNVVAGNISTSGALTIADVDAGQSNFTAQASAPGSNGFGTFTLAANGVSVLGAGPDLISSS